MPTPTDAQQLQHLLQLLADEDNFALGVELAKSVGWQVYEEMDLHTWGLLGVNPCRLFQQVELWLDKPNSGAKGYDLTENVVALLQKTGQFLHTLKLKAVASELQHFRAGGFQRLDLSAFGRLRNLHISCAFIDVSKLPPALIRLRIEQAEGLASLPVLPELRNLDVDCANLDELQAESFWQKMPLLTDLALSAKQIRGVLPDALGRMPHLQALDCEWLALEEIPAWAHRFAPQELVGDFAPRRRRLPKNIHFLGAAVKSVRIYYELKARNNGQEAVLEELDGDVFALPALESLNITLSRIKFLPENIYRAQHLRALLLPNNALEALPAGIAELPNLHRLEAPNNQIKELLQPIPAYKIMLNNNPIAHISEAFADGKQAGRLMQLNLSHTNISALPENLGNFEQLQTLNVSHAPISDLPASMERMQVLKRLELARTRLQFLPKVLGQLGALEWLDCAGCDIRRFSQQAGEDFVLPASLHSLYLGQNRFLGDTPAQERGRLVGIGLLNLSLSGCGWVAMNDDFFTGLPNLEHLNLSRNKDLERLPASFFDLRRLESVDLRHLHVERLFTCGRWQRLQLSQLCRIDIKGSYSAQQVREWQALMPEQVKIVRH